MILIWAIVYGLLAYVKPFGKNNGLYAIIGFVVGIIVMLSENALKIINYMIPWFILIFILIVFLVMAYMFLGAREADVLNVLTRDKTIVVWILIIFFIIFIASLGKVFFTKETPIKGEGNISAEMSEVGERGEGAFWATLFHPKVLGLIFVLLIAVFTLLLLTEES
jgi:hypothetical protein